MKLLASESNESFIGETLQCNLFVSEAKDRGWSELYLSKTRVLYSKEKSLGF